MNDLWPPGPAPRSDDQLATIKHDVALLDYRLGQMETRHELVPTRVTMLEQRFEHMSGQLAELNEGQRKLTAVVSAIASKITWALAIASTLWAILQMFGPVLLRVFIP